MGQRENLLIYLFVYLFIYCSKRVAIYTYKINLIKNKLQFLLQAYISKQMNAFRAKQYNQI